MNLKTCNIEYFTRRKIFIVTFILSVIIHGAVFIRIEKTTASPVTSLSSRKSSEVLINYTIQSSQVKSRKSKEKKRHLKKIDRKLATSDKGLLPLTHKKRSRQEQQKISQLGKKTAVQQSVSRNEQRIRETYMTHILRKIHRMKYYPRRSRRMKEVGVVTLKFTIKSDGNIKGDIHLVRGCRFHALNHAGIKTIVRAGPFPSFPEKLRKEEMSFVVDIEYTL